MFSAKKVNNAKILMFSLSKNMPDQINAFGPLSRNRNLTVRKLPLSNQTALLILKLLIRLTFLIVSSNRSLQNKPAPPPLKLKHLAKLVLPRKPNISITINGVSKQLSKLNPGKAAGPDNLSSRILKELHHEIAPMLTDIFNTSLCEGKVPDDWRNASVTPVYKKGPKTKAENYRPISLTCICCKVMEHVITSNIMSHLDKHKLLQPNQHGFRSKLSCETQLIQFVQ